MKIEIPSINEQQKYIFEESTKEAIKQLKQNLNAPVLPGVTEINEADYPNTHLLTKEQGWEAPEADLVAAYFRHFQSEFAEYGTDKTLAQLLGVSSDRRVREFKNGDRRVPYDIWRKFLILTGRSPQDVLPVLAFMG